MSLLDLVIGFVLLAAAWFVLLETLYRFEKWRGQHRGEE